MYWDFSWLNKRIKSTNTGWDYSSLVNKAISKSQSMLDMGTGGGEFLLSLPQLPAYTVATEAYKPNLSIAKTNLSSVGVDVAFVNDDSELPVDSDTFDLIINRHESYKPREVARILSSGGYFLTQQVGNFDNRELNRAFADNSRESSNWNLNIACRQLTAAGFDIIEKSEEFLRCDFLDIASIVYYLKGISWQIPGLNLESNDIQEKLYEIYKVIKQYGSFPTLEHRFYLKARINQAFAT